MKTLHLLRHAKSAWDNPGVDDRDRELNARGQRDAPRMGAALAELIPPMTICSSPARRAQLTLEGLCAAWPQLQALPHQVDDDLYTFSVDRLWRWLAAHADNYPDLFIIAHNPALTELVNELCGEHSIANIPTAGYVQLHLEIDRWRDLLQGCAHIHLRLFPKQLGQR
jgi:phosphohistidine phosphatase